MATSSNRRLSLALPFLLFLLVPSVAAQAPPKFRCGEENKCQALAGFVPATETTYEAIRALFQVASIYDLYGANGLNEATQAATKVPANATVRVPFPCACANGTGVSDRKPVYTAKSGDSLQKIAGETFAGLVAPQQIAAANGIINASSTVEAGKALFIPLPCSCDYIEFVNVIHLAHVVKKETNLVEIAAKFFTFPDTLLSFNNISGTQSLVPGQVLDLPLHGAALVLSLLGAAAEAEDEVESGLDGGINGQAGTGLTASFAGEAATANEASELSPERDQEAAEGAGRRRRTSGLQG